MSRCDKTRSPGPSRLSRARRAGISAVGIGIWLTGVLWLVLHYFVAYPGRFGPARSPLEPWSLTLHGAFGFAAIWIFGLLRDVHVQTRWPARQALPVGWPPCSLFRLAYRQRLPPVLRGRQGTPCSSLAWTLAYRSRPPVTFAAHRIKGRAPAYVLDSSYGRFWLA
jgi:hypothetical protein